MRGSVRKKGNNWYYRIEMPKKNGQRQRYERCGGETKELAYAAMNLAIQEYKNSGHIIDSSNMSTNDYLKFWYDNYVMINLKYNTQQNYAGIIKNHLAPTLGQYRLKDINPGQLQALLNQKFHDGLSKSTLTIIKTVLNRAFRSAVYPYQFIKEDPTRYIDLPRYNVKSVKDRQSLKLISLADFYLLAAAVPVTDSFYVPMMIAFHTGLRRAEVCGLCWQDLNFEEQTLTVERIMINTGKEYELNSPKTQSSYRKIPIGKTLLNILKDANKRQKEQRLFYGQHYHVNDFVSTKENGEPVTPHSIKWSIGRYRKLTGINFNFHSFRHTHATMLLENGAKIKSIQDRLGHSRLATTMDTYAHVTKKMQSETVDLLEQMLANENRL